MLTLMEWARARAMPRAGGRGIRCNEQRNALCSTLLFRIRRKNEGKTFLETQRVQNKAEKVPVSCLSFYHHPRSRTRRLEWRFMQVWGGDETKRSDAFIDRLSESLWHPTFPPKKLVRSVMYGVSCRSGSVEAEGQSIMEFEQMLHGWTDDGQEGERGPLGLYEVFFLSFFRALYAYVGLSMARTQERERERNVLTETK